MRIVLSLRTFLVVVIGGAAIGCEAPPATPEPTTLRLEVPQRRAVVLKTTIKQTVGLMGEKVEQNFEEDLRYTLDIDAADATGDAAFTYTLDFFSLDMESDVLDSATGGMDPTTMMMRPTNEVFRAARGLSFTGVAAPDGSVRSVDGLDEVRKEILKRLEARTLPPEFSGTILMEDVVNALFDDEGTREGLSQILLKRPLEPLVEGVVWSGDTASPFGSVDLPASVDFTVATATPDTIMVTEKVTLKQDDASIQSFRKAMDMDSSIQIEIIGSGSGTYHIDPVSGWVNTHTRSLILNILFRFDGGAMTITTHIARNLETFSE